MCRWPDCDQPTSDGSTLMCRHHAAHCDAALTAVMDLAVAEVVRGRQERHGSAFVEHTERPRPEV